MRPSRLIIVIRCFGATHKILIGYIFFHQWFLPNALACNTACAKSYAKHSISFIAMNFIKLIYRRLLFFDIFKWNRLTLWILSAVTRLAVNRFLLKFGRRLGLLATLLIFVIIRILLIGACLFWYFTVQFFWFLRTILITIILVIFFLDITAIVRNIGIDVQLASTMYLLLVSLLLLKTLLNNLKDIPDEPVQKW